MTAYFHLSDMKEIKFMEGIVDVSVKQRLIAALAATCRIDDIEFVLDDNAVTDTDLVLIAEPLIMTG